MKLGDAGDFFFTAKMNSCAVHIGGTPNAPTVVHSNANVPETPEPPKDMKAEQKRVMDYMNVFYPEIQKGYASKGVLSGTITDLSPNFYMKAGGAFGFVFGIKQPDKKWVFYYTMNTRKGGKDTWYTDQLWPKRNDPK
jgi:hypothetical protein